MVVDAVGGGAEGKGAGPVQTSAAGRNAGPRPVGSKVGGRSVALAVAGDRTGGRETHKSRAPFNPIGFGLSFFLIQQNPILIYLKQMDIHIQADPNPVESKSKSPIEFDAAQSISRSNHIGVEYLRTVHSLYMIPCPRVSL